MWNSDSRGARPVHLIITMIKWIQTSRLSIEKSLSLDLAERLDARIGPFMSYQGGGGLS
jgi:hypothetical protein